MSLSSDLSHPIRIKVLEQATVKAEKQVFFYPNDIPSLAN
jgi:hypothetical protein